MNIHDVTRRHVELALQYCAETLGYSKYEDKFPTFTLYEKSGEEWGRYDSGKNHITLFKGRHQSAVDLMDTVVHEYTHYLQDLQKYNYYSKKYGYGEEHPLEEEAMDTALRHKWLAKKYIANRLKK